MQARGGLAAAGTIAVIAAMHLSAPAADRGGAGVAAAVNTKAKQAAPVKMGTSGGWSYDLANGYCCGGTLGSLVRDADGVYILSNFHVFAGDVVAGDNRRAAALGDPIVQPGLIDVNCTARRAQTVGYLAGLADPLLGAPVDAALAVVAPNMVDLSGSILGIGQISSSILSASPGQAVKKTGRTTALTRSSVLAVNGTIRVAYDTECAGRTRGTATFTGQIVVANNGNRFLAGGDSGSLLVEDRSTYPRAVGLLFAGSRSTAIANPIDEVLSAFGVTMVGGAGTAAAAADRDGARAAAAMSAEIRKGRLAQDRLGRRIERIAEWVGHGVGADASGAAVLKVFVERNPDAVRRLLPDAVEGVPVEVEEVGRIVAF